MEAVLRTVLRSSGALFFVRAHSARITFDGDSGTETPSSYVCEPVSTLSLLVICAAPYSLSNLKSYAAPTRYRSCPVDGATAAVCTRCAENTAVNGPFA